MSRIVLDGLHVSLGDLDVLRGLSATVGEGDLVGLLGPNGAGKTTLLRTIAGILDPDAGSVSLGGTDVHTLGSKTLSRRLATVPQETAISFDFTVRDVVAMGRHPHRPRFGTDEAGPAAVEGALDRTDVVDLADRPITEVSGGERKRVLVARALAQDARTLLLDEPTAGLDVNHQIRTLDLVRDLVDEGRTALAAIHDLDLAARYCDELLVLSEGRILAAGRPEDVLSEATVREAFDARNAVAPNPVAGTPTVTPLSDPDVADPPRRVHLLGGRGEAVPALAALVDAGHEVSVGPVPEGSREALAADRRDCELVAVPPFAGLGEEARARAREAVAAADAVAVHEDALNVGPNRDLLRGAGRALVFADAAALVGAVEGDTADADDGVREFGAAPATVPTESD